MPAGPAHYRMPAPIEKWVPPAPSIEPVPWEQRVADTAVAMRELRLRNPSAYGPMSPAVAAYLEQQAGIEPPQPTV